jgi:hypothetical protein
MPIVMTDTMREAIKSVIRCLHGQRENYRKLLDDESLLNDPAFSEQVMRLSDEFARHGGVVLAEMQSQTCVCKVELTPAAQGFLAFDDSLTCSRLGIVTVAALQFRWQRIAPKARLH